MSYRSPTGATEIVAWLGTELPMSYRSLAEATEIVAWLSQELPITCRNRSLDKSGATDELPIAYRSYPNRSLA